MQTESLNKMVGQPGATKSEPRKSQPLIDAAPEPIDALPAMGDVVLYRSTDGLTAYDRPAIVSHPPRRDDAEARVSLTIFELAGPTPRVNVSRGDQVGQWRPRG